jgi:Gly-Xaa carboxypeptidase
MPYLRPNAEGDSSSQVGLRIDDQDNNTWKFCQGNSSSFSPDHHFCSTYRTMEKSLPTQEVALPTRTTSRPKRNVVAGILLPLAFLSYCFFPSALSPLPSVSKHHLHHLPTQCAQPAPLVPSGSDEVEAAFQYISSEAFRNGTILRLSGAVQVPTQSYDDMGVIGKDKRWDVMYDFAKYLKAAFPRVHKDLKVEKVNTHGLVFTWQGSDEALKPTLLMAHQDVVPVPDATLDAWTHPPFEGVYDGTYIWSVILGETHYCGCMLTMLQ